VRKVAVLHFPPALTHTPHMQPTHKQHYSQRLSTLYIMYHSASNLPTAVVSGHAVAASFLFTPLHPLHSTNRHLPGFICNSFLRMPLHSHNPPPPIEEVWLSKFPFLWITQEEILPPQLYLLIVFISHNSKFHITIHLVSLPLSISRLLHSTNGGLQAFVWAWFLRMPLYSPLNHSFFHRPITQVRAPKNALSCLPSPFDHPGQSPICSGRSVPFTFLRAIIALLPLSATSALFFTPPLHHLEHHTIHCGSSIYAHISRSCLHPSISIRHTHARARAHM
jgi:hypothetical protein